MFGLGVLAGIAITLLAALLLFRLLHSGAVERHNTILKEGTAAPSYLDDLEDLDNPSIGYQSAQSYFGLNGALILLALMLLALATLVFAIRDDTLITVLAGFLGLVAAACGWTIKNGRESLYKRARLLIIESLDRRDMTRPEIREVIFADSILFRLNKSTYVEALNDLYQESLVTRNFGTYKIRRTDSGMI